MAIMMYLVLTVWAIAFSFRTESVGREKVKLSFATYVLMSVNH